MDTASEALAVSISEKACVDMDYMSPVSYTHLDKPGLFSNGRIVRDNLPEDVYCYDLRGSDYDPGEPVCVEEQVVVNHAGSVLLTEPLELAEDGRLKMCIRDSHDGAEHRFRSLRYHLSVG